MSQSVKERLYENIQKNLDKMANKSTETKPVRRYNRKPKKTHHLPYIPNKRDPVNLVTFSF